MIFQRNLSTPKVEAIPGSTCTVNDDLVVTKILDIGCITVFGGCLADGGQKVKCSPNAESCTCDKDKDIATVTCKAGYSVVGGGCESDSHTAGLSHSHPSGTNSWVCNWNTGVGYEKALAICCRIKESTD